VRVGLFGFRFGHHINSSKHLVTNRFGRLARVTAPSARHCHALGGHGRLLACRSARPVALASCGRTLWCPRPLVHMPCHVRPRAAPAALSVAPVLKEEASAHNSSLILPLRSLSLSLTLLLAPPTMATDCVPASSVPAPPCVLCA
jgi:hypothetical protein